MRILLDNGILGNSEFGCPATQQTEIVWGPNLIRTNLAGFKRKKPDSSIDRQAEIDSLFTIGRLIDEEKIIPHTYSELQVESFRRTSDGNYCNPIDTSKIIHCCSPLERSKFRQTIHLDKYFAKGGKKDRKKNDNDLFADYSQLPFMKFILDLDLKKVAAIKQYQKEIKLTDFEIESLDDLDRFKLLCKSFQSVENYIDAFHIWTAERHKLDVFLTFDKKLTNNFDMINSSKNREGKFSVKVLSPCQLLKMSGIPTDKVPLEDGYFYSLHGLRPTKINDEIGADPTKIVIK